MDAVRAILDALLELPVVPASRGSGSRSVDGSTTGRTSRPTRWTVGRSSSRARRRDSDARRPGPLRGWAPGSCWSVATRTASTGPVMRSSPRRVARRSTRSSPTCRPSRPCGRRPTSILALAPRIDVVVDNAGAMYPDPPGLRRRDRDEPRHDGRGAVRPARPALAAPLSITVRPGSSRSPPAGCMPNGCRSTISSTSAAPIRALAPTLGQSAPRSRWSGSGRGGSATGASSRTPCTRAGPTRPAWRHRCRASARHSAASSGHPRRARTPSSGSPPRPRRTW